MNPGPRRLSFSIDHSAQVCRCVDGRAAATRVRWWTIVARDPTPARGCPAYAVMQSSPMRHYGLHYTTWPGIARSPERDPSPGVFSSWNIFPLSRGTTPDSTRDPTHGATPSSAREILSFLFDRYFGRRRSRLKTRWGSNICIAILDFTVSFHSRLSDLLFRFVSLFFVDPLKDGMVYYLCSNFHISWETCQRWQVSCIYRMYWSFERCVYRTICTPSSRPLKVRVSCLHPLSLCIMGTFPLFLLLPFNSSRIVAKFIILENVRRYLLHRNLEFV